MSSLELEWPRVLTRESGQGEFIGDDAGNKQR